jgi:protein arginine N-methyltransferase 1
MLQLGSVSRARWAHGGFPEVWAGEWISLGRHGWSILGTFVEPLTLADAFSRLSEVARGQAEFIEITTVVLRLRERGVLVPVDERAVPPGHRVDVGYAAPGEHVAMLDDRVRVQAFLSALEQIVEDGDVVVELGTGTGILAVAAAKAGARKVLAIEASGISKSARLLIEENGVDDRVEIVCGWSTGIDLPEKANVFISEMIGNDPLAEGILELTIDARKRFLEDDATLIPARISLFAAPVDLPDNVVRERTFTEDALTTWEAEYGIDFSALGPATADVWERYLEKPQVVARWPWLSAPVQLLEIDLATVETPDVDVTATVTVEREGRASGAVLFWTAEMGHGSVLSLDPRMVDAANHWLTPVWVNRGGVSVSAGDEIEITYERRVGRSAMNLQSRRE